MSLLSHDNISPSNTVEHACAAWKKLLEAPVNCFFRVGTNHYTIIIMVAPPELVPPTIISARELLSYYVASLVPE